jgi:hypothetical protein
MVKSVHNTDGNSRVGGNQVTPTQMKACTLCGTTNIDEFYDDGLQSRCRLCHKLASKVRYHKTIIRDLEWALRKRKNEVEQDNVVKETRDEG